MCRSSFLTTEETNPALNKSNLATHTYIWDGPTLSYIDNDKVDQWHFLRSNTLNEENLANDDTGSLSQLHRTDASFYSGTTL